jgi:predicted lipoprotein with Yx(FWY)xxD motif
MNMFKIKRLTILGLISTLVVAFSSCSKDDDTNPPANESKGIQVRSSGSFGNVLTDKDGKTLYFFSLDAKESSACTGGCEAIWPVYYSADASTDMNINKDDIGVITRADGSKQSTYKGWPLYYYASDTNTGDIKGDGINSIWFVAKPDYILMVVNNQLIGADGNHYKGDLSIGEEVTQYFTDDKGRTLYAFAPDKFNTNTFTKEDFSNDAVWPIYQATVGPVPSIISQDLVANITVFGKTQLTYRGWPLYYFGQDANRGDNKGVSVPQPGVWPVVNLSTSVAPTN